MNSGDNYLDVHRYNDVWAPQQEQLEAWLVAHDNALCPT